MNRLSNLRRGRKIELSILYKKKRGMPNYYDYFFLIYFSYCTLA